MYWVAQLALWGWVPVVLVLFMIFPPRRAVVISLIGSWLFLPQLYYDVPLVPDYTKVTATSYGIILGAILLDPKSRVLNFKPMWIDIPMVVWCISPFFTSISNELGAYDGGSLALATIIKDGLPYLIGRLYFRTPEDAKDFALGIVIGGLVYVPLCLFEIRMSPQLHNMVYGFSPFHDWQMAQRWGGWRPTVFMKHGLALGVWMTTAAAIAFWLWRTKALKDIWGIPMWLIGPIIIVTAVLCKTTGALVLFSGVLAAMLAVRYLDSKFLLYVIVVGIPLFLIARTTQLFTGSEFATWLGDTFPPIKERADSLLYRMDHENAIIARTYERPLLGWGGWGRAFDTYVEGYNSRAVPDSMWIRSFGQGGFIGLIAMYGYYLIPAYVLLTKMKAREWSSARCAPVTGMAMVILIYAMDCLFNTMENPVFIVAIGAVAGMAASLSRSPAKTKAAPISSGRDADQSDDDATLDDGLDSGGPLILIDRPIDEQRPLGGTP